MKGASFLSSALALCLGSNIVAAAPKDTQQPGFDKGQPYDGKGKGAVLLGGTNKELDLQNPDNLGQQPTDNGVVPNLKWSFSDSKTRLLKGGWVREQVIQDLPSSHDISGAQQHLVKGAIRELHWHKVAEWGIVYNGSVLISAVDEFGRYQEEVLNYGDIWYFPKGAAHTVQGLADENEYLLVFDEADFDKIGTTFMVDDWINHTPKSILAKNFGVNASVFENVTAPNPYILPGTPTKHNVTDGPAGKLSGNSSFVYRTFQHDPEKIGGTGAGDTAAFPDNSGHYIENTSEDEDLIWIEVYKSDRVADISLTQWLALTPPDVVAQTLNVSISFVESLKKEKQVLIE
ncbi:oxalate decarboxylase [Fusarium sp. NRRL 52700]|nr:oxalate decarboxylase [Fusarium sp. NRRL 52700]